MNRKKLLLGAMSSLLSLGLLFGAGSFSSVNAEVQTVKMVQKNTSAKATGIYQGLVDGNSFEVKISNQYKVFRFNQNAYMVKDLERGNTITFTYWVNGKGQNILGSKLQKDKKVSPKPTKSTSAKAIGIYQGKADNHSFEVKVGNSYTVIRFTDKQQSLVDKLKKGDTVSFTYWVNIKHQNILGSKLEKTSK